MYKKYHIKYKILNYIMRYSIKLINLRFKLVNWNFAICIQKIYLFLSNLLF